MMEMHDKIFIFIERFRISNILRTSFEEFKFNSMWGTFFGGIFLISHYDPRRGDSGITGAMLDNLPLVIIVTFILMILLHGFIIHVLCWVTSILIKYQIRKESRNGKLLIEKIKQTILTSDSYTMNISDEVERIVQIGISNEDIETNLIPFLLEKSSQSRENEKAKFISVLRGLSYLGYWKQIYDLKPLDMIISWYESEYEDVRFEADYLFSYLIRHETIDEILKEGLLEMTIANITKCNDFCDNGLFSFCVFGKAENIIPHVIPLLEDNDPAVRRKVVYLLAELGYANEIIADELDGLENERKTYEKRIELDMRKLFFDPPFFARPIMPIEAIEERRARFHAIDSGLIGNAITMLCEVESNESVREAAFSSLSLIVGLIGKDDEFEKSLGRPRILNLCQNALNDENILIRSEAIATLGYLGDPTIIQEISELEDNTTLVPPPTPLTLKELEEDSLKEKPLKQRSIGEVAKDALKRLQRKVKNEALEKDLEKDQK